MNPTQTVNNFTDLINTPFQGQTNAIGWERELLGDFSEIVRKVKLKGNITELDEKDLLALELSDEGKLAREILIQDLNAMKEHGASPVLNVIKSYDRDDSFFPTDVYSFHVDRSPVPTDTFLCTYYGESSEILPNEQGTQKILIPEIRKQLLELYDGEEDGFDSFLEEYFFDLHYQAEAHAKPIKLALGHLWRLAVDHPESKVLPCLHRAPKKKKGELRLLMIC